MGIDFSAASTGEPEATEPRPRFGRLGRSQSRYYAPMGDWIGLILFVIVPVSIPVAIGTRRALVAWKLQRRLRYVEGTTLSSRVRHDATESTDEGGASSIAIAGYAGSK